MLLSKAPKQSAEPVQDGFHNLNMQRLLNSEHSTSQPPCCICQHCCSPVVDVKGLKLLSQGLHHAPSGQWTSPKQAAKCRTDGERYIFMWSASPLCVQASPVRVVVVSSAGHMFGGLDIDDMHFHRRPYSRWMAYGQSKLCNILFAKELARR